MRIWRRRTYEQTHLQQCDQHWQPTSKLLKWYIIKHGIIGESDIRWLKVCPCSYRFLDHCIVLFCGILVMQYCMLYLALTSYHPLPVPKVIYLNTAKNERKWLKAMGTCGNKTTVIVPAQKYPQCIFCSCLTLFKVSWCWTIFSIGLFNDYGSFDHFNYALIDGLFLDSIIMSTVQIVYCWRLRQLGGWRVIPAVAAFVSILQHWLQSSNVDLLVYSSRSFRVSVGCWSASM